MDMLKRELAPLSEKAWQEIEDQAKDVLKTHLSARKAVKVNGPKGWDYTAISEGRLELLEVKDGDVKSGVYKIKPLVESRVSFTLDRWELDNVTRGAKDIDLGSLEDAVKKIAIFEENAVYNGYTKGGIQGLGEVAAHKGVSFGKDGSDIMEAVSRAFLTLKENFENGPFALIVGQEAWKRLNKEIHGFPLINRIEELMSGKIIYSPVVDGAFMIPYDHDDLELTVGQDFAIGYESHNSQTVTLFITESFTFRVLDANIIVKFNM